MGYLLPTDYESFGLSSDTTDDWITVASALIDTHCRRTSLSVTQYTERLRIAAGSQTVQLTYLPLAPLVPATLPLVSVQARYGLGRRGEQASLPQEEIWWAFSLPGSWVPLDPTTLDWTEDGCLTLPRTVLGLPYNEVAVTYTGGLPMIPDAVKSACALIVKNAQATPGMNVKSSKVDTMQVAYFSDSLLDSNVKTLLRPWVAKSVGIAATMDTNLRKAHAGPARIADTLLRTTAGAYATLLMPPAVGDTTDAAQLGLNAANFQALPLAPVVFRKVRATLAEGEQPKYELLIGASAVLEQAGNVSLNSADSLFQTAAAVVVAGETFQIESWAASESLGTAYLYRLLLRVAQPQSIRVGS